MEMRLPEDEDYISIKLENEAAETEQVEEILSNQNVRYLEPDETDEIRVHPDQRQKAERILETQYGSDSVNYDAVASD
jgi:hypothetical protein